MRNNNAVLDTAKYSDWLPVGSKPSTSSHEVNYVGNILTKTNTQFNDIKYPLNPSNSGKTDKTANIAEKDLATMPTLAWPTERWVDSKEKAFRKHHAIVKFLERVWNPFIKETGAAVTREILKLKDLDAEEALTRHLERHPWPNTLLILYPEELEKLSIERPVLLRSDLLHKMHI